MDTPISTQSASPKPLNSLVFSPDGNALAAGGDDSAVRIFDVSGKPGAQSISAYSKPGRRITKLSYSPSSELIVLAHHADTLSTGSVSMVGGGLLGERDMPGHTGRVTWVDFAPNGKSVASASLDLTARTWDVETGKQLQVFVGHSVLPSSVVTGVWCVRYAPDGKVLATSGSDGTVRLWDAKTAKEQRKIQSTDGVAFAVAYSPDGDLLAASHEDGTIKVYDPSSGKLLRTMAGHSGWVVGIEFSPDGSMISSAGYDGTARLWNANTGEPIKVMSRGDKVHDVAFSPGGRILATAGDDGTVKQYAI